MGNASAQVAGMGLDAAQGKEVRDFDTAQVGGAVALGAVGAVVPAVVAASEMGLASSLTAAQYEAALSVSGLSTAGSAISVATETAAGKAYEQVKEVYKNH